MSNFLSHWGGLLLLAAFPCMVASFIHFRMRVTPSTLRLWADREGYATLHHNTFTS